MKTLKNLLLVLTLSLLASSVFSQNDGLNFKQENLDNLNKSDMDMSLNMNISKSSSTNSPTSFGGTGSNKSIGPGLIIGGLIFGTVGVLGGTLGGDYEGSGVQKKPFYRQGAHFLAALTGGVCLTTGFIITLN